MEKNKTDCNNNKSMELQPTKSENRFVKSRDFHKRGLTSIDVMEKEKENKESIVTERRDCKNPKVNFKSKIFLIAFDEQNKYRPVRKRELHQRIFGVEKQRQKYQKINELR